MVNWVGLADALSVLFELKKKKEKENVENMPGFFHLLSNSISSSTGRDKFSGVFQSYLPCFLNLRKLMRKHLV